MKKFSFILLAVIFCQSAFSQIGIGTTSPNSTLDVRGSLALNFRSFTGNTLATVNDYSLVFTGTSAATITLPDASSIPGRNYWIKNASSNGSLLTIATTSSQTIDGLATWTLPEQNKALNVFSNGSNWYISAESTPGSGTGTAWIYGGNSVGSAKNFGTTNNADLPILTNNTERMRITNNGNVGIGTSSFNGANPEKLLVDAGSTLSFNVISGKGTINNYLQLNIQNNSSGNNASADLVATANNGNETVNYVDVGINSSTYNAASFTITGPNDAYLYSAGNDLAIGNATSNKVIKFFTGGTLAANERMRISAGGDVAIGTTSFNGTNPEQFLVDAGNTSSFNVISGKGTLNNYLQLNIQNRSNGSSASSDLVATADNGNETINYVNLGINSSGYAIGGILGGVNTGYLYSTGTDFVIGNATAAKDLIFFTGGTAAGNEKMRVTTAAVQPGTDNSVSMGTSAKRWSVVYAVNGTIQTSDFRLKKNIAALNYGLNEVMLLRPVAYNWKDNTGSHKIGLIAQDVRKIIPEVVSGDENREMLGMNYAELVPVLINAIKELKKELDDTRKELRELKENTHQK